MTTMTVMMIIIIIKLMMVMLVIQFSPIRLLKGSATAIKKIKVKHCRKCYNRIIDINDH
jgi:hypothetical protein